MIYSLSLGTALLLFGLLLLIFGAGILLQPVAATKNLLEFPRSKVAGWALLLLAAVWSWLLIKYIDLGEFSNWRPRILILIPIAAVLTAIYVDEFLAVRALGMVTLLAAEPLLEAAFLKPELSRLLMVTPVYALIVAAMFWIGMPYVLRDHLQWLTSHRGRLHAVATGLAVYGGLLVLISLTLHRSA